MKRYLILTIGIAVIMSAFFILNEPDADPGQSGGFYGDINYTNCDCSEGAYADKVMVKKLPSGTPDELTVLCYLGDGDYDSELYDQGKKFESGTYQLWVEFGQNSDCTHSSIVQVTHGSFKQKVDLTASGPSGNDD